MVSAGHDGADISHSSLELAKQLTGSVCSKSQPTEGADIVFLGDSVSSQMSQYFICDLLGLGAVGTGGTTVAKFNHTYAEFTVPSSIGKSSLLRIHNKQFNLPCMHANMRCNIPKGSEESPRTHGASLAKEELVFSYVSDLLDNFTKCVQDSVSGCPSISNSESFPSLHVTTSRPLFIVFNYGLHVHGRSRVWAARGVARALTAFASKHYDLMRNDRNTRKVFLLYRETSAQSFWYSVGTY